MERLDVNNKPTIGILDNNNNKCLVKYETRSMFISKLIDLSCNYHRGINMIQFKCIIIRIENIMCNYCQNTIKYKLSCGELLSKYRQFKNIHKLESYIRDEYIKPQKQIEIQTPIERLLLTKQQLEDNGYPIKTQYLQDEYKDFIITSNNIHKNIYNLLAIDCEMCKTIKGNELTRISIVDSKLMVVYDKLVKPSNKIIDYLTEWSGITKNLLSDVTRTINDVHDEIFQFINSDTILCGHSLENDLIAMKIIHYKVVDTAVLYMKRVKFRNNKRNIGYSIGNSGGRKLSLKHLCQQYLNKTIQSSKGPNGEIVGHSSVEDAIAAMQLLQLQLKWEQERNKKLGINNNNNNKEIINNKSDKEMLMRREMIKKK
eukprot:75638_1